MAIESSTRPDLGPPWCLAAVVVAGVLGLILIADQSTRMSATYDEVTYLEVGSDWWRTGRQESISRQGSPLTFWKLQQAPSYWVLDRIGRGAWIDDPIRHQAELLPVLRIGASWTWLVAMLLASNWARKLYSPRAMAMTAVLFALEPNLLAHASLITMEMPLVAASSAMLFGFWSFLTARNPRAFWASAASGGLSLSCKFTTILFPPILGLAWALDLARKRREADGRGFVRILGFVGVRMAGFVAAMVAADLFLTAFATIPLSPRVGEHPTLNSAMGRLVARVVEWPMPQDWVGLATQMIHQRNGGPSYLLGERRMTGWISYYPIALGVKVPLGLAWLVVGRLALAKGSSRGDRGWMLPVVVVTFLLIAMAGSKRNYGLRYLLPLATPASVWVSALAEGGRRSKWVAGLGLLGMAFAVASVHPHELSYFNEAAGGPIGGRKILSDSNLDWGQGAKDLAKLQRRRPEFGDLTLFYFGSTDPIHYGVEGRRIVFDANHVPPGLVPTLTVETEYLGVSASLQWGPWGPDGYFRRLNDVVPVAYTDDRTIAIYRRSDLR